VFNGLKKAFSQGVLFTLKNYVFFLNLKSFLLIDCVILLLKEKRVVILLEAYCTPLSE
jgi:hypothetical protein